MARPKNLATKGPFSVLAEHDTFYLCYKGNKLFDGTRSNLYRQRKKYSSWFSIITRLIQSYGEC